MKECVQKRRGFGYRFINYFSCDFIKQLDEMKKTKRFDYLEKYNKRFVKPYFENKQFI